MTLPPAPAVSLAAGAAFLPRSPPLIQQKSPPEFDCFRGAYFVDKLRGGGGAWLLQVVQFGQRLI